MGLTQSPVYCLHNISSGNNCVLILDQLDALRWTSQHSISALAICKELISQAKLLNKNDNGHISLVLVSRTFDLENDSGIKSLFSENDLNNMWSKIEINTLSESDVANVLGDEYYTLSHKLKNLLLTPSSLYIWNALIDHTPAETIKTPFELMENGGLRLKLIVEASVLALKESLH